MPIKIATLKEAAPFLILDLRRRTEKSHYYQDSLKNCSYMELEIEKEKVHLDTGRAVKDKNATMKKLCQQLVASMKRNESVMIICYDGLSTSGFIAMIVKWWYLCSLGHIDKDFDYLKDARDGNDFTSGKSKEQREQMKAIKEEALKIMGWEQKGFVLKKSKTA